MAHQFDSAWRVLRVNRGSKIPHPCTRVGSDERIVWPAFASSARRRSMEEVYFGCFGRSEYIVPRFRASFESRSAAADRTPK